jgi:hypothetical protein
MNQNPLPLDYQQPRKGINTRRLKWIFFIAGITLVGLTIAITIPAIVFVHRQKTNMALARRHIPMIQSKIAGDPRFVGITLSDFTGSNGCLLIDGSVAKPSELAALRQIVAGTSPPVFVHWDVSVVIAQSATSTAPSIIH